jgi:hypothetical protein
VVGTSASDRASREWEDEGGSLATAAGQTPSLSRRARRAPQDTAEGCHAMAAADMARAALEPAGWARIKFEHSAVAWSRRAEELEAADRRAALRHGG